LSTWIHTRSPSFKQQTNQVLHLSGWIQRSMQPESLYCFPKISNNKDTGQDAVSFSKRAAVIQELHTERGTPDRDTWPVCKRHFLTRNKIESH
jgi:hypothetical protein